jgi:hypothetical protein
MDQLLIHDNLLDPSIIESTNITNRINRQSKHETLEDEVDNKLMEIIAKKGEIEILRQDSINTINQSIGLILDDIKEQTKTIVLNSNRKIVLEMQSDTNRYHAVDDDIGDSLVTIAKRADKQFKKVYLRYVSLDVTDWYNDIKALIDKMAIIKSDDISKLV